MQKPKLNLEIFIALFILLMSQLGHTEPGSTSKESHPGLTQDADYAEAVFEFTNKRYSEAIRFLDQVIGAKPDHIQALELKALALKNLGRVEDSMQVYESLILAKPKEERTPYHFELGSLYFKRGKFSEARNHLLESIDGNFNVGASHFFLGTIELKSGELKRALRHFSDAIPDVSPELQVACHYYLGIIHSQRGFSPGATGEFIRARDEAEALPESKMAHDIGEAASKALAPYDKTNWFRNITLTEQYDGNVSSISSSVAPENASGKTSLKTNFSGMIGYASSPLQRIQPVVMYRISGNLNYNSLAKDYEFITNTITGYFTYQPLARNNAGIKLEGNFGFQYREDPATTEYSYRPYSYSGEFAPFVKTEWIERNPVTAEISVKTQSFSQDGVGIDQRSGWLLTPRMTAKIDTPYEQLSPTLVVGYELNHAKGSNQDSRTLSLDISNSIKLPGNHALTPGVTLASTSYSSRVPEARSDKTFSLRVSWGKPISPRLLLTGDASLTLNNSNLSDIYSYTKPVLSLGITYQL